jgi:Flp pilus assembly pilin Flp
VHIRQDRGASAVEFTLLVAAMAAAVLGAASLAGQNLQAALSAVVRSIAGT